MFSQLGGILLFIIWLYKRYFMKYTDILLIMVIIWSGWGLLTEDDNLHEFRKWILIRASIIYVLIMIGLNYYDTVVNGVKSFLKGTTRAEREELKRLKQEGKIY